MRPDACWVRRRQRTIGFCRASSAKVPIAKRSLMLAALHQYPALESEYAYAERVAERRWRIVLKNGTALELGADREIEGFEEIAQARAVAPAIKGAPMIVDVRTPGRIAMRPADVKPAKTASLGVSVAAVGHSR